jgi:choline dehydrogenase-like flavoprotein
MQRRFLPKNAGETAAVSTRHPVSSSSTTKSSCSPSSSSSSDSNSSCPDHDSPSTRPIVRTYDFIVVGAGNAGCPIANRLSENGKHTVCLVEGGRDDARLPELLPERSPAPVPQPGDYHWGSYVRGTPLLLGMPATLTSRGFAHLEWFQEQDDDGPSPKRKTTQSRHFGWGGCTSHNACISIRNQDYNWKEWRDRGLTDFDASTPTSNLVKFQKKAENRTAVLPPSSLAPGFPASNLPFYDSSLPVGTQGSFDSDWYGTNGMIPLMHLAPFFGGATHPFVALMLSLTASELNANQGFSYPTTLVDLDHPPSAANGGWSYHNWSAKYQFSTIVPPAGHFGLPQVPTPIADYNAPMYPTQPLYQYPSEYARLGFTGYTVFERSSANQSYLYPALSRKNLTVISEALVTKVIVDNGKARGIEYLRGWNIYQTGHNCSTLTAGYGGTRGDARYNAHFAKEEGTTSIFAKKEVIICAGVFNTPQILQLSGIGDPDVLEPLGIPVCVNLPGVGKNLLDNNELFISVQGQDPEVPITMAVKSDPSLANPNFEIVEAYFNSATGDTSDNFIQKTWMNSRPTPAIHQNFVRNDFENVLIDTNQNPVNREDLVFTPIQIAPEDGWLFLVEQEDGVATRGYVNVISKDPTVPPKIIYNYMQEQADVDVWLDVLYNNVFPLMLQLKSTPHFTNLLYPAPIDFLQAGVTYANWTSINQVDEDRLVAFLHEQVGGHHAGGTCMMGVTDPSKPFYNPDAVVDQKGRVRGVKGLRVCDMSVVPVSIRWPNITMYTIAEKIAADILAAW